MAMKQDVVHFRVTSNLQYQKIAGQAALHSSQNLSSTQSSLAMHLKRTGVDLSEDY